MSDRRPRAVVLGNGFLGGAIATALEARSLEVTVLSRSLGVGGSGSTTARFRAVDVANRLELMQYLQGADVVVYAVGSPPPAAAASAHDLGMHESLLPLISTIEVLRVTNAGAHMIYLSSGGTVYGEGHGIPSSESRLPNPVSAYGVLKLTGERFIEAYRQLYGLRPSILRIGNAYGPGQPTRGQGAVAAFMSAARTHREPIVFGDGSAIRDYIHVADVAQIVARVAVLGSPVDVLNVGTGIGTSVKALLGIVERVSGRELRPQYLPARGVDVQHNVLDITRMTTLLDVRPRPLLEGAAETWESGH